jgi:hypothetical protein
MVTTWMRAARAIAVVTTAAALGLSNAPAHADDGCLSVAVGNVEVPQHCEPNRDTTHCETIDIVRICIPAS